MGWWNASREGNSLQREETGLAWGDGPADAMDDMLHRVKEQFIEDMGRLPTKGELRAGLEFSIMGGDDSESYGADA